MYSLILSAFFVSVLALPAQPGVSVPVVPVPKSGRLSGVEQVVKTQRKFGIEVAAEQAKLAAQNSNARTTTVAQGSVPAYDPIYAGQGDVEYVSPVTIGWKTFSLGFDTGSSDLWVFSTKQPATQYGAHNLYDPSTSEGQLKDTTWSISYGDVSSASGLVYMDRVTVGGLTVTSQAVEAATDASSEFTSDPARDGLLGLAFNSLNSVVQVSNDAPDPQKTWFFNIVQSLSQPLFAVIFKHLETGSFDFGYLDSTKYKGVIQYADVDISTGFWTTNVQKYQPSGQLTTILDTGTSLSFYEDDKVSDYYQQVQGAYWDKTQQLWLFPCITAITQDFPVYVGQVSSVVEAQYINFGPLDPTSPTTCFGGIQPASLTGNMSILGDTFHKGKYIVYDFANGFDAKIGVAWQPGHGPSCKPRQKVLAPR